MTPPIALQLYTVRELLAQDFHGTMEQVAAMGFVGVETAFFENVTPSQAAEAFTDLDLVVPAVHCEVPLGEKREEALELAATFGCRRLVWHGWPQDVDYSTVEGIKRLADRYNHANDVARANGCSFGIHNHWWEFEAVEGHYPYQILRAEMDDTIFFEVDTYWVKTAGLDPTAVVAELGDRVPLLHLKDGPAKKGQPMLAAGQGVMDFPAIIESATHSEWFILEMDECATDMLAAIQQSYRYLTAVLSSNSRGG